MNNFLLQFIDLQHKLEQNLRHVYGWCNEVNELEKLRQS